MIQQTQRKWTYWNDSMMENSILRTNTPYYMETIAVFLSDSYFFYFLLNAYKANYAGMHLGHLRGKDATNDKKIEDFLKTLNNYI